jgi:rhodanese-related sulfurtransferase
LFLVPEIKTALQLEEEEFSEKFGFSKPISDEGPPIVVHCMRGARAEMAHNAFREMGFNTK